MKQIPIEVSARHVHLTEDDWKVLFGSTSIASDKPLSQQPNFSAVQRVTLRGPKGELKNVAIVGPFRPYTQAELSMTDARILGITPPLSDSGDLTGAATITLTGPNGELAKPAAILQKRHLHISPDQAEEHGLQKDQIISMRVSGPRGATLENILVRIHPSFSGRLHLDTDEGNAFGVEPGMTAEIRS